MESRWGALTQVRHCHPNLDFRIAEGGALHRRPTGLTSCLEINVKKLKVSETECGWIEGVATINEDLQVPCTGWNVLRQKHTAE